MKNKIGYCGIGLNNPKDKHNIGSIIRACSCFDVDFLQIEGKRISPKHCTNTTQGQRYMPTFYVDSLIKSIPYDCIPVGVEFIKDSCNLVNYIHPERAVYFFGPEDGNLNKKILEKCRDIVYIPSSYCLNLAATCNVVLYDRLSKQKKTKK